jgi:glycosyltransferase involved in cell wall biosynthesis
MKIGFVSTYALQTPPLGYGGEVFYWGLAKYLSEMGHEVHLFAAPGSETPPGGVLHTIRGTTEGRINYNLETEMEQEYHDLLMGMDIVHDCSLSHIPAERLRYLYGKKEIVNTINGCVAGQPRPPFNVVSGSHFWQRKCAEIGMKTEMIYWGVDTNFYTPEGQVEDYLLWIARFHPDKGLDLALDLAELMGFKLVIAGSMQYRDHAVYGAKYLERIKNLKNVTFVQLPMDSTHHIAKRELYRHAKAFLYPVNYDEGFGMVIMEAMACGCPVITSNRGSMIELITDKVGKVCVEKKDYHDAIESIDFGSLRDNARQHAMKFSVEKSAERYGNLYEKVRDGYGW